jgi:hypothetical protein
MQDRADVVNLIKAGIDLDACRRYVATHAPALSPRLEDLARQPAAEEE